MPPSVNIRFAALANADGLGLFGAILAGDLFLAVSHAGRLAALGADQHHVGGVNSAFLLEDAALLALTENLQRRDLDCWEEAQAIARLISRYGLSQEEAARRLGRAQPTVANKLRLLRLPEDVRALLRENGLTERHARALLRLQDPEVQRRAAGDMVRRGMNVAQAEAYVEKLLQSDQVTPPRGRSTYIIKDVRLFLNSVDRGLHLMRQAGVDAGWNRQDTDREILLTIRIPKRASGKIDSVSESC